MYKKIIFKKTIEIFIIPLPKINNIGKKMQLCKKKLFLNFDLVLNSYDARNIYIWYYFIFLHNNFSE